MENTQTETKPVETQAPVTEQKPAPVVEKKEVIAEKPTETVDQKEQARQAFTRRETERKQKEAEKQRIADLERKAKSWDEYESKKQTEKEPVNFLDNPEEWARGVEERAAKRAEEAQAQREAEASYRQSTQQAADWLLSLSHHKEDKALLGQTLKVIETEYADLGASRPQQAALLAYLDVCASKGITPDIAAFKGGGGLNAAGGKNTSGLRPSVPSGGKRVFTKAEAEAYVFAAKPGSNEYADRMAEVKEAQREGRVSK